MSAVKLGYKHLETDDEFAARVQTKFPWWKPHGDRGEDLDYHVWYSFKMQRRLVEVFP